LDEAIINQNFCITNSKKIDDIDIDIEYKVFVMIQNQRLYSLSFNLYNLVFMCTGLGLKVWIIWHSSVNISDEYFLTDNHSIQFLIL